MNLLALSILYPALRSLLVNRLQKQINFEEIASSQATQKVTQSSILPDPTDYSCQFEPSFESNCLLEIPLNQIRAGTQLEYVSALAFKLAQSQSLPPFALAEQIKANLNCRASLVQIDTPIEQIWQGFIITIVEPGWIHLRLTDSGLADWLQWAVDLPWQTINFADDFTDQNLPNRLANTTENTGTNPRTWADLNQDSVPVFEILHAHARCCSLLHLSIQEQIIQMERDQDFNCLSQVPIPWLNTDQSFRAQHLQEWGLILQLSEALDYLADSATTAAPAPKETQRGLKAAHRLSQAFQRFYAACPILGIAAQDQSLAQVRLGLVLLTRKVLKVLIEARLRLNAHSML